MLAFAFTALPIFLRPVGREMRLNETTIIQTHIYVV